MDISQTEPDLPGILELIKFDLPGYTWVLRNTKKGERGQYFANIQSPDFEARLIQNRETGDVRQDDVGKAYPTYGKTEVEALLKAYRKAMGSRLG